MINEADFLDPLTADRQFAEKVRDAAQDAWEIYYEVNRAYGKASAGAIYWPSGKPAARLVRSLEAALRMESTEGCRALASTLANAASEAKQLDRLLEQGSGMNARVGVALELFRAQYQVQGLMRALDAAVVSAERLTVTHQRKPRPRDGDETLGAHRTAPAALHLREASARQQPIEVTLPGMLIGIAVLFLPTAHRARYSEEFQAEVRELPSNEQVGYAVRQCIFALTLRRGLVRSFWRSSGRGADRETDAPRSDGRT